MEDVGSGLIFIQHCLSVLPCMLDSFEPGLIKA